MQADIILKVKNKNFKKYFQKTLDFDLFIVYNTVVFAAMAELADALDSGSSQGDLVEVQVLLAAPQILIPPKYNNFKLIFY